ncbi:PREDICTED: zinc finger protein 511 [Thamnophis sirtalis]|uniref:Zinc finger protein 511 n=1 Tax=Thamnophis sirtalis TaxID=35019 RepID=A0A6I9YKG8_9SAUR|nr:PREDICTED: zinc finger protein 511 [Thamnophis sirtalis]
MMFIALQGVENLAASINLARKFRGSGPFRVLRDVFQETLEVHMPVDVAILEEGMVRRVTDHGGAETERTRTSEFSCQIDGCCQVFNTLESYEHHYNMLHRNVCSSCKRAFPSTHLLDVHILEWHDSLFQIMAEKQNMYQCLVESCPEKFKSSKDRKDHLITVHQYPSNFRFDKSLKAQRKEKVRPSSKESNVPMDMTVEDSEQLHVEAMEIGPDEHIMESDFQSETESTVDSPAGGKWLYKSRIPSTICFGQGATRVFKGRKKKS